MNRKSPSPFQASLAALSILAVLLWLVQPPPVEAQLITVVYNFSGAAFGTFDGTATPVGFWIQCVANNAGGVIAHNGTCVGSLHFNSLGSAKGVTGPSSIFDWVNNTRKYIADVSSSDGAINCELVAYSPLSAGPSNGLSITCTSPAGSAGTSTAVIHSNDPAL